jgi:putative methionine-R-sulfoxide reductase with GAF domain
MDPHSILDKDSRDASLPAETPARGWPGTGSAAEPTQGEVRFPGEDGGKSLAEMAERDLTATLQLLAERAQYITGATGAAIALRDCEEMVCRASSGTSAPEVGAQLQVNSGLSGESVRTRQTLRCDDAFTDNRVNRESCEALGIRSVVVMPLLRGDDVIGVFELFSDKANIFEPRDITALERMGAMVHTALEHTATALGFGPETGGATRPAIAEDGFDDDEPGFATKAALAQTGPAAFAQTSAVEVIQIPEVSRPAATGPMGRFEALAAAKASLPRSGIAFHSRVPTSDSAPSATSVASAAPAGAAPALAPVEVFTAPLSPSPDPDGEKQPAVAETLPAINDDPLEMPQEAEPTGCAISQNAAAEAEEELILENEPKVPAAATPPALPNAAITTGTTVRTGGSAPVPTPSSSGVVSTVPREEPPAPVVASRGAVANLRKCEACGFPVSEGRQLCLDCEKKKGRETTAVAKASIASTPGTSSAPSQSSAHAALSDAGGEMPRFLGSEEEESWLATHKFMVVAVVVAVVGIVVVLLGR